MNDRKRFDLAATAVAAIFVAFAGVIVWRSGAAPKAPMRVTHVAWRCDPRDSSTCNVVSEIERCTSCHDDQSHAHRDVLIAKHANIGCVACHGGDGLASVRATAHEGLGETQSRCATCHASTASAQIDLAPMLTAGRRAFVDLRCGACHDASESSKIATPLDVLGVRAPPSEIATALANHKTIASYDLGLDDSARASVAAALAANAQSEAEGAMLHRASVPGSSAEEGRTLETKLACNACHDAKKNDLASVATSRTPDWVAFYLLNPLHANPAATMPSLRLTAREASSLAQFLVRTRPATETMDARARHDGEGIIATKACASCHAITLARSAPSLSHYGSRDRSTAIAKLTSHAGFTLDDQTTRDLATYLLSQRDVRARPDLRIARDEGAALWSTLACEGCHALDDVTKRTPGPSLFGEGLRAKPQWLFEYLRAPELHPVRPPFHPEWVFRDLVPADRVAVRMPTYALDESQTTSLVRFFSARDHASFPFAASQPAALSGEALTSAIADLTHKDRGACTSCHTIAIPDVARAAQDLDKLAPPLALAHDRLRPAWIDACILQAPNWVVGMPAFGKPDQAARLRDLVLLLRERTVLPPAGAEGSVPALGLGDVQ